MERWAERMRQGLLFQGAHSCWARQERTFFGHFRPPRLPRRERGRLELSLQRTTFRPHWGTSVGTTPGPQPPAFMLGLSLYRGWAWKSRGFCWHPQWKWDWQGYCAMSAVFQIKVNLVVNSAAAESLCLTETQVWPAYTCLSHLTWDCPFSPVVWGTKDPCQGSRHCCRMNCMREDRKALSSVLFSGMCWQDGMCFLDCVGRNFGEDFSCH